MTALSPVTARLALLCGAAMLIPVPWVDSWVERQITRKMFANIAAERGHTLSEEALHVLTEDRSSLLLGCLFTVVIWPLKKLFRTVLYFLTLKDMADGAARAAHRAQMLALAIEAGAVPDRALEVRALMDALLSRYQVSPVTRWLMRHERPPLDGPAPANGEASTVLWLLRHAGGGALLSEFRARIGEVSP